MKREGLGELIRKEKKAVEIIGGLPRSDHIFNIYCDIRGTILNSHTLTLNYL